MVELKAFALLFLVLFFWFVVAKEDETILEKMKKSKENESQGKSVKNYKSFKKEYNKTSNGSEKKAEENFIKNLNNIETFNKRQNETYLRGFNSMSDLSFEEKKKKRMGLKRPVQTRKAAMLAEHVLKKISVPSSVNYTRFFPPIKNQKDCGGCWAFAAVSVVEYWSRRSTRSQLYSEQNLIDCVSKASGCQGGWPTDAFDYIRDQGISDGTKYVYKEKDQSCQRTNKTFPPILKIPNSCEVELNGNEEDLKKIIAQYGPVAGAMAVTDGFTNYQSGIFYDKTCSNYWLDHAITIVGYGTDKSVKKDGDYWIIRNSWGKIHDQVSMKIIVYGLAGTSWGMQGYGHLARNRNNSCGIALYAMFPC